MWSWSFQYENGKQSATLNLPLGRPVKLSITSVDMLHSLSIPAFRVKEDAVPGRETYLWFLPDEAGTYDLFRTRILRRGTPYMTTKVEIMPVKEFESWYAEKTETEDEAKKLPNGAKLVQEKGCVACHSLDGTAKAGPTLRGVHGRKEIVVTMGKEHEIVVNQDYLKRSLLEPQADIVKGYPPIHAVAEGIAQGR